jgi:LmbE family N-acetylglucosaminyl deacetylase
MTLAAARTRELAAACTVLGARSPVLWGLPDGGLAAYAPGPQRVAALLRHLEPDLVLTLGPDGVYGHPDHIAVYRWVKAAWEAAPGRPPLLLAAFPRGLFLPQYEKCIGMMGDPPDPPREAIGTDSYDYEVKISTVREQKLAAIAAHRTQLPRGNPRALFPKGVVDALLDVERFVDASGAAQPVAAGLLRELAGWHAVEL